MDQAGIQVLEQSFQDYKLDLGHRQSHADPCVLSMKNLSVQ